MRYSKSRANLLAIRTNIKKQERHQISNLIVHLKQQEKEPKNPKDSRGKKW